MVQQARRQEVDHGFNPNVENNYVTNYNAFLSGCLAYYEAICFGYLDPDRNACSYTQGIICFLMLVVVTYPLRLVGEAIVKVIVRGKDATLFTPLETLKWYSIAVLIYATVLLISIFMISAYTHCSKYNYLANLLISSCVWAPLLYLVAFHPAISYVGSVVLGTIMHIYVLHNIQMFVYTAKDTRESQIMFVITVGISISLVIALVSII